MRKTMTAFVAVGVLALGACGGDDDKADDGNKTENDDNEAGTPQLNGPEAATPFCQEAVALFNGSETSAAIEAAQAIDPPDELAEDWETWISGIEKLETSDAPVDSSDPAAAAEYEEVFRAAERVITYIGTECGAPGFAPTGTTLGG